MIQQNWGMQYFALQTTMFCDVVLRRKDHLRRPDIVMREMMALQRFDERTKMAAARQDVTSIEQENIALRWEIQALRASSSWRMTAPLRAAKRIVTKEPVARALFSMRTSLNRQFLAEPEWATR